MKKLILLTLLLASVAVAQTNIEITSIARYPSPAVSNYSRIDLMVTNIYPNQTYAMPIARRLELGFAPYVVFSSPSNSILIQRDMTNSIPIRFYRVQSTNIVGLASIGGYYISGPSEWDSRDIPCEECDLQDQRSGDGGTGGNPFPFPFFNRMMSSSTYLIDPAILDIIMPPPLRRARQ